MSRAYDAITDRIIAKLEEGVVPWCKPWYGKAGMPKNLLSGNQYRGINVFMLHCLAYESPYFLTFNQAKKLGGHVKQGEKGCPVVFWKLMDVQQETDEDGKKTHKVKQFPILRYYTVFNVAQTEGIESPSLEVPERDHTPIISAEEIVRGMPKAPEIRHGHTGASYSPTNDLVQMPRPEVFENGETYYSTVFHELTHSTGHRSRLDRKSDRKLAAFGSPDYSREELVAEMGSAFLCGEAGILDTNIEQSAAYIDGWLRSLRNDRKLVVVAAAQAQKAADYILGHTIPTKEAA
jgi:antirestriction protein ArdC